MGTHKRTTSILVFLSTEKSCVTCLIHAWNRLGEERRKNLSILQQPGHSSFFFLFARMQEGSVFQSKPCVSLQPLNLLAFTLTMVFVFSRSALLPRHMKRTLLFITAEHLQDFSKVGKSAWNHGCKSLWFKLFETAPPMNSTRTSLFARSMSVLFRRTTAVHDQCGPNESVLVPNFW